MPACPHHKETLMLDVFGELNQDLDNAWKQHLNHCHGCSAEKDAMTQTLRIAKTVLDAPSLGEVEAAFMRERVIRDLSNGTKHPERRKPAFFFSRTFIPAFASACVLLIALGFVASKYLTGPEMNQSIPLAVLQEQLPADDLAIINNLDLLSDLDALNKLAKAIDRSQSPSLHNNVQGKNSHGQRIFIS